jgi:hypothetical protein
MDHAKNLGLDPYKDMSFIQVGGGPDRTLALMNDVVQRHFHRRTGS